MGEEMTAPDEIAGGREAWDRMMLMHSIREVGDLAARMRAEADAATRSALRAERLAARVLGRETGR